MSEDKNQNQSNIGEGQLIPPMIKIPTKSNIEKGQPIPMMQPVSQSQGSNTSDSRR